MKTGWLLWDHVPPMGTIVHVTFMSHLVPIGTTKVDGPLLSGGLFGEIETVRSGTNYGRLTVLTLPAAARRIIESRRLPAWAWDQSFPFNLGREPKIDNMCLERVPEDIQDAVRAAVALHGIDQLPLSVDDGWLCEGG